MLQIGAKTQRFRCGNIETIIMSDLKKIKLTIPTKVHGEIRFHGLRVPPFAKRTAPGRLRCSLAANQCLALSDGVIS